MAYQGNIQDLQTAEVVDSTGDKVGKVGQVYLTNDTQDPSWVTVNTGLFGTKETFIPLAEANYSDGAITVPYEKSFIKDAPRVDEDGEISREEEDELYRYYGIQDTAGTAGTTGTTTGTTDRAGAQDRADRGTEEGVTLHEERADVGTERVQTGKVRLRKHVVTETEHVEVPVEREELVIEREPVDGQTTGGKLGDDEVEVTLSEERPVVNKETVATEKVNLGKRTVEDTETVDTKLAHEEVDIDRPGKDKDRR